MPEGISTLSVVSSISDEALYVDPTTGDPIVYRVLGLAPALAPEGFMDTVKVFLPTRMIEEFHLDVGSAVVSSFEFPTTEELLGFSNQMSEVQREFGANSGD